MTSERQEKVEKLVKKLIGKVHITGIKGQKLHSLLRNIFVTLEIKSAEKGEVKIEQAYDALKLHLEEHLLSKVEHKEDEILKRVANEFGKIYAILHSSSLFVKADILDLMRLEKILDKKGVVKDAKVRKEVREMITAWHEELDAMRKSVNEAYQKSKGNMTTFNTFFKSMHKTDSIMARLKERALWKDGIKLRGRIEHYLDQLENVKSAEELHSILDSILEAEKKVAHDFEVFEKFLFAEWDHVIKNFDKTVTLILEAAKVHEVPTRDSDDFIVAKRLIMGHLVEQYLHSLRIEEKQLEAELAEVEKKN